MGKRSLPEGLSMEARPQHQITGNARVRRAQLGALQEAVLRISRCVLGDGALT